jgi:probable HAF family extracellular repeat protein
MLKSCFCAGLILAACALRPAANGADQFRPRPEYVATPVPIPPPVIPFMQYGSRVVDLNDHGDVLTVNCTPAPYTDGGACKAGLWSTRTGQYRELFNTCGLGACTQRTSDVPLRLNERGDIGGLIAAPGPAVVNWSDRKGLRAIGEGTWSATSPIVGFTDSGEVAGVKFVYPPGVYRAYFASERTGVQVIGPAHSSMPSEVNQKGEMVGYARFTAGSADNHAFYWNDRDGMIDIGALFPAASSGAAKINKHGLVLGYASAGSSRSMFLWQKQHGLLANVDLPDNCGAGTLTDKGEVVGTCGVAGGSRVWFWSQNRGFRDIGALSYSEIWSAYWNHSGQFAGAYRKTPGGPTRAYVWSAERGMVDLDAEMPSRASAAWAINEEGVVGGLLGDGVTAASGYQNAQAVIWTPRKH